MKMLQFTRNWIQFRAADSGGASGGAASQNGTGDQNKAEDPFAKIDEDSLDDDSRAALKAAKEQFATLQTAAQRNNEVIRQHQSERDKATAELNRVRQSIQNPEDHRKPATTEDRVYAQLVSDGLPPESAKAQSKTLAKILETERQQLQQQLGQQFAPVATLALQNQAEGAFNAALATDHLGWSSIPEVAELVWQSALELTRNGQQADASTIRNLAFMHFGAYTEKNPGVFASLQNGPNQPNNGMTSPYARPNVPNMGQNIQTGFSYPGANFLGRQVAPPNPNGARTVMDAGTSAAMNAVNKVWEGMGLKPKA